MRSIFTIMAVVGTLVACAAEAHALAWGGGRDGSAASIQTDSTKSPTSVPEPSTLYAIGSGIALLGGAGWYIRRRK